MRTYSCPYCGLIIDRDHNSVINILNRGLGTTVQACGIESLDSIVNYHPIHRGGSSLLYKH